MSIVKGAVSSATTVGRTLGSVMQKSFVRGERPQKRAYSPAVITRGVSKIIWIAGHTGHVDDNGKSLAGDFDAQCRQTFRNIERTLGEALRHGDHDGVSD
jgi:enamine deaminase RidA (YjgF/YER057c/UK114 family)